MTLARRHNSAQAVTLERPRWMPVEAFADYYSLEKSTVYKLSAVPGLASKAPFSPLMFDCDAYEAYLDQHRKCPDREPVVNRIERAPIPIPPPRTHQRRRPRVLRTPSDPHGIRR
ncbi:MAG: hypothetical protein HY816_20260 [Candidatus Wallbacteria bacterium]|nr:hypothetical protein [Candidatus Wallbacteria bacterium]